MPTERGHKYSCSLPFPYDLRMDLSSLSPSAHTMKNRHSVLHTARRPLRSAFIVAGTHSGVGKTTVTLGLLAALRRRGLRVQPFKVGPDFIDPGLHRRVAGATSYNLDGWMLSRNFNLESLRRHCQEKDAAVVEGVMGLFDGFDGKSNRGSTAEMAKWLGLPVILVVDASAMARSVAALVLGFLRFDPKLRIAGVIFNRVAGEGHLAYLRDAMTSLPKIEVLGGLPSMEDITIPERHLGLMTAVEGCLDQKFIRRLAGWIENHIDLDPLLKKTCTVIDPPKIRKDNRQTRKRPITIGVAQDQAFCFYYPDNLNLLKDAGARLVPFSPMRDRSLPPQVNALYLGGGYPEIYSKELARNRWMRNAVRDFIESGGMVYAECGGLMYLTNGLIDLHGRCFPMVGIYPVQTRMLPRLKTIGYREITTKPGFPFGSGVRVRGHEFHFSELKGDPYKKNEIESIFSVPTGSGKTAQGGYRYKHCFASYVHLHFGSNPTMAERWVEAIRNRVQK